MNNVNIVNDIVSKKANNNLGKRVHIVPLGHEIDRAVAPFHTTKPDLVFLLSIPQDQECDPEMMKKQHYFTNEVLKKIESLGITCESLGVNLFDVFATMRDISWLIRQQKNAGNFVEVNMSACGKKTSVAVALVSMIQDVTVYYVSAQKYSSTPKEEKAHGLSIVNSSEVFVEPFVNFSFSIPDEVSQRLLAELYLYQTNGKKMKSDDIVRFLQKMGIEGYEITHLDLPPKTHEYSKKQREMLNKINRQYIQKLTVDGYIIKTKFSKYFIVELQEKGKYMACTSGFVAPSFNSDIKY